MCGAFLYAFLVALFIAIAINITRRRREERERERGECLHILLSCASESMNFKYPSSCLRWDQKVAKMKKRSKVNSFPSEIFILFSFSCNDNTFRFPSTASHLIVCQLRNCSLTGTTPDGFVQNGADFLTSSQCTLEYLIEILEVKFLR